MRPLYDYTLTEVADMTISDYAEEKGISKALARKLFINALIYNCVTEEIVGQMDFLREEA